MNRIEVLLEALKECNRHIEAMIPHYHCEQPALIEARLMANEIKTAILVAKDEIGSVAQRTELDGSNIKDAGSIPATPANPALENVLAKLRDVYDDCKGVNDDAFKIVENEHRAALLTLGDLRRWVESEKGKVSDLPESRKRIGDLEFIEIQKGKPT